MGMNILLREITPFEKLVCENLCEGLTNSAIAKSTSHSEKVIENTVSRVAQAFSIRSDGEVNVRVLLALMFRAHFGDRALKNVGTICNHISIGISGKRICSQHIH